MAVDHNHNKPSTNSNWLTQMAASQSANNNPINIESKCKSKPTAPAATSSNSSNQQRRIITADDLHNDKEYARWSKIKKEGINIYFGCRVCKQFARGKGKYGKDEWPLSVTVSDIVNKTNAWQRVKDSYRHHSVDANHIMCMGAAHNSDYFNTIALKNQLRAHMYLVENGDPDIRYPELTHLIQDTHGFIGDIGRSVDRLPLYDRTLFKTLKDNLARKVSKERPWGGPAPYMTTADGFSRGVMGSEVHGMMMMLHDTDVLRLIAFPIGLSPISSAE
eukprot:942256_1